MSSVLIVIPILVVLMFDLGLGLRVTDFRLIFKRPRALLTGLIGQILFLPAMAFALGTLFGLTDYLLVGLLLIACCPGGSSSNVFTGIAKGDVALSVSLTALSSVITMITLPLLMGASVELPVANLIVQNLVLVLVPISVGMVMRVMLPSLSDKIRAVLSKVAFPALMLLATIFFVVNRAIIAEYFGQLFGVVTALVLCGMTVGGALAVLVGLNSKERRTLVIEVGMQNAAQAMALAASPFVFNQPELAIPATVYALMMNVLLLIYVGVAARFNPNR